MLIIIFKLGRLVSDTFLSILWIKIGSLIRKVIPIFLSQRYKITFFDFIYYYHFAIFNFKDAYEARASALKILLKIKSARVMCSKKLLALEWQFKCYQYYIGEQHEIPLLDFITVPVQDLKKIKSLIVGPKYKKHYAQDIDLHIFLKPYDPTANSIKKSTLLQNDSYYLKNIANVENWVNKTKSELIFTKQINLPCFELNASLMGLQRAVFYLIDNGMSNKILINGFDLNTDPQQYNKNYPSLLPKDNEKMKFKLHFSLARHDYLINLIFIKLVIDYPRISTFGDVVSIINENSISNILDKVHNSLRI